MNIQEILNELKSKKMTISIYGASYSPSWNVTITATNADGDALTINSSNGDLELAVLSAYSRITERMNSVFMVALPRPELNDDIPF